jgi:hypothetical protein
MNYDHALVLLLTVYGLLEGSRVDLSAIDFWTRDSYIAPFGSETVSGSLMLVEL